MKRRNEKLWLCLTAIAILVVLFLTVRSWTDKAPDAVWSIGAGMAPDLMPYNNNQSSATDYAKLIALIENGESGLPYTQTLSLEISCALNADGECKTYVKDANGNWVLRNESEAQVPPHQ